MRLSNKAIWFLVAWLFTFPVLAQGIGPAPGSGGGGATTCAGLSDASVFCSGTSATGLTGLGTGVITALGNTAGGAGGFALVGTTPPTGAAGGSLAGTYPNPSLAAVNSISTSLAVGGATIGTNAIASIGQFASYGATTTGPGFYAYLNGDTLARVRIGLDANDVPSLAFGAGGASTRDTFIMRKAAATLQFGTSDAAAPVAQVLRTQSVIAGTSNTAGANFTIGGSVGTGTGAGGDVILQTANTGSTGSTQNTLTNALVLKGGTQAVQAPVSLAVGGATISTDALAWTGTATGSGQLNAASFVPTSATVPTNGMYLSAANTVDVASSSTSKISIASNITVSTNILNTNTAGFRLLTGATSSTVPTFAPNRTDATTGIGAQASGNVSLIAGATERVRVATGAASVSDILLPGTLFTGGTATTTFPQIFVQPTGTTAATTWSTSGTIFGANVVSGFAGNFLDFHTAGGGSLFLVNSGGTVNASGSINAGAATNITWSGRGILSSPTTGSVQFGTTDAASPIAQTTRVQSVVAGTAAANGANWTLIGSLPTGTGTSGDIIFQTGVKTGSGTTQGTATTALTIKGETQVVNFATGANFGQQTLSNYTATTWTPTITTDGTVGTPAYTRQVGSYEIVGRQVTARFVILLSGWTGSPTGSVSVGGLPVAASSATNDRGGCVVYNYSVAGLAALSYGITGLILPSGTTAAIQSNGNSGTVAITAAQFGTTGQVEGACFYHT